MSEHLARDLKDLRKDITKVLEEVVELVAGDVSDRQERTARGLAQAIVEFIVELRSRQGRRDESGSEGEREDFGSDDEHEDSDSEGER